MTATASSTTMPTYPSTDEPHHPQQSQRLPINPRPSHRLLKQEPADAASGNAESAQTNGADREVRPPAKRARKAINCEPCRASKLKCDRARPCSSCVLRGTSSSCYQDARDDPNDDHRGNRIDPHHEIARIRHSLATLEAYVIRGGAHASSSSATPAAYRNDSSARYNGVRNETDDDERPSSSVPGMLARKDQGGLYAGPTSAAAHLLSFKAGGDARDTDGVERASSDDARSADETSEAITHLQEPGGYDQDLLEALPPLHIIDGLVDYYFENCNWIYPHVYPPAFQAGWTLFKSGQTADRLVLSTLCVIMAVAIRYLPERHALLVSLSSTHEELGQRYYDISRDALARYRSQSRTLSLELVELLLIRTHYLTLSKNESEEIWAIRGELMSLGTAMGLHRDPDKWRMPREVAERRRWAWWHIILLERWQCFLFGRPLSIATHHFDAQMPSYVDPNIDPSGQLYSPNIHLFKLAYILGDIVDDAVSIRPVPYERVQEHDRRLVHWMDTLPQELDLDEYRLARALASPMPSAMRLGIQSIIVRASCHHIRFTLHRPYAAAAHDRRGKETSNTSNVRESRDTPDERYAQSLDTAVNAADKLIQLVGQARMDLLNNSTLAVPGHVHWGPFHCFSAAMFFSFQLIANPDQPGANLFRANIRRVLDFLSMSQGVSVADKGREILTTLAPLYEPTGPGEPPEKREEKKRAVLAKVKNLAFPYHDSPAYSRSHIDSPGGALRRHVGSPSHGRGLSSSPSLIQGGVGVSPLQAPAYPTVDPSPSAIHAAQVAVSNGTYPMPYSDVQQPIYQVASSHHVHQSPPPPHMHPQTSRQDSLPLPAGMSAISRPSQYASQNVQPRAYGSVPRVGQFVQVSDDMSTMWGASVGFGPVEWERFVDEMQRPDITRL